VEYQSVKVQKIWKKSLAPCRFERTENIVAAIRGAVNLLSASGPLKGLQAADFKRNNQGSAGAADRRPK